MPNPLRQAIESAIRSNDIIGRSFARVGTSEHPEGFIVSAYRDANEALALALESEDRLRSVLSIIRSLRARVSADVRSEMLEMISYGEDEANRQLSFYKEPNAQVDAMALSEEVNAAVKAIEERINAQEALVQALILTDAENEQITGNEDRVGVLRASDVTAMSAAFIASFVWDGFLSTLDMYYQGGGKVNFQKQAIAALDHRTTETCLRVHAQIVPFYKPFHLVGEPRYADYMDFPAFHPWCRTSVCLYDARFEDGITRQMASGAKQILRERAEGKSGFRKPADAFG